jgi:hypothetical protein
MTRETKSEIIVVGAAMAFLLWLWLHNRAVGGGTGAEGFPSLSEGGSPLPGAAPLFDIPAPVPGYTGTYDLSPVSLPDLGSFNIYASQPPAPLTLAAGLPASCNCSQTDQSGSTFGSLADLSAWLNSQPAIINAGVSGLNDWN